MARFFGVILTVILACYIAPPALQAQHHDGGGSHAGAGGGGMHAGAGVTSRPAGSLGRPVGPVAPFVNSPVTTFGRAPLAGRPFVRPVRPVVVAPVFGYGFGYGYGYPGYYPYDYSAPYYSPASEPYYSEPQPVYVPGPTDSYGTQSDSDLSYQVGRLTQEVEDLRQQQRAQAAPAPAPSSIYSPVVLIFKDGRQMEVQNYAIIGQTLWVLDEKNSSKVSLDDLDLDATQHENRARGVRFSVPGK